jgi:PPOX class probable FMN-dependent enzyme
MTEILEAEDLCRVYSAPKERSLRKEIGRLDEHCRRFIALSPFVVLSTATPEGCPDISPRGGDPGFIRVHDEHTLLLPDRPGNNRLDTLGHLAANPRLALLFFVPGIDETLRVYGQAKIVRASEEAPEGRQPSKTVLRVHVNRAFFHCAKALMRSHLWDARWQIERATFPTMGEIMRDHTGDQAHYESQENMLRRYLPEL